MQKQCTCITKGKYLYNSNSKAYVSMWSNWQYREWCRNQGIWRQEICIIQRGAFRKEKDAQGVVTESTVWVSVLWYGDGGGLTQYLKKGCKVFVRGRLSLKTYQDKHGNTQIAVNVNANEVTLCGLKGENQPTGATTQAAQAQPQASDNAEDDLPF